MATTSTTPNKKIEIYFGVAGGVDINKGSGAQILEDLNKIAENISSEQTRPKVIFGLDIAETRKAIETQLKDLTADLVKDPIDIKIKLNSDSGQNGGRKAHVLSNTEIESVRQQAKAAQNVSESFSRAAQTNENYNKALQGVDSALQVFNTDPTAENRKSLQDSIKLLNQYKSELNNIEAVQKRADSKEIQDISIQKRLDSTRIEANRYYEEHKNAIKSNQKLYDEYQRIINTNYDQTQKGVAQSQADLKAWTMSCQDAGIETETIGKKMTKLFKEHFSTAVAMAGVHLLTNSIKQLFQNVIKLDGALTDLQIATGYTREKTRELLVEYSGLAKELGATTAEVAEAADTWLRQGYSVEEANALITQSMMLSKLGQMESADASTALTSALKGYKLEAESAASVVDKLTAVDMKAAATAGGLATAMAETANSANISGVGMDKLIGQIAVVKEVNYIASL